jgi:hypothetical protein
LAALLAFVVVRPDRLATGTVDLHDFERADDSLTTRIAPLQEFESKLDCLDVVPAFVANLGAQRLAIEELAHLISFLPGRMADCDCHAVVSFPTKRRQAKTPCKSPF